MTRASWDFDYAALHVYADGDEPDVDLVVATVHDVDAARLVEILGKSGGSLAVTPLLSVHPLFWFRLQVSEPLSPSQVSEALTAAGVAVRYVTSVRRGTQKLGVPASFLHAASRRARDWRARAADLAADDVLEADWFLGEAGVDVDRTICGTGAGTRLAIIDNEGLDVERLDLDAEILVGVDKVPRNASHAALMIGWAVGSRGGQGPPFRGVAPHASPRFYCIPKPDDGVAWLPLAIVRAVVDGADVVACATYVDGQTSPLLDDAMEFATLLGRGGRGTAVVFASSREMSSPARSSHASLSLGMAEPGSDFRAFCVGPSSRDGAWFLWRDRKGRLHPFANRGPALRWLAPGDDLGSPLGSSRPVHGESSAACAISAGVLLLLFGTNPEITLNEVDQLMSSTAARIDPAEQYGHADLADAHDLLPLGVDADGHNAKHGYGRLCAALACAAASHPLAAALIQIGERRLALSALRAIRSEREPGDPLSRHLAACAARALLQDAGLRHGASAVARAVRLWLARPERSNEQPAGVLLRQLIVLLRRLSTNERESIEVIAELKMLERRLRESLAVPEETRRIERALFDWLSSASPKRAHALGSRVFAAEVGSN